MNRKLLSVGIAVLISLTSAAAWAEGSVDCADSTGRVVYHSEDYIGGAPPIDGLIGADSWSLDDVVVAQTQYYEGGPSGTVGTLVEASWGEMVVVQEISSSTVTYAIRLELTGGIDFFGWVICEAHSLVGLP